MNTPPIGSYIETAALHAVMEGRIHDAKHLIGQMHPRERDEYATQLETLARLARGTSTSLSELLGR